MSKKTESSTFAIYIVSPDGRYLNQGYCSTLKQAQTVISNAYPRRQTAIVFLPFPSMTPDFMQQAWEAHESPFETWNIVWRSSE
jgi:hypothetical protein